jgi:ribosomal protein L35
MSLSKLRSKPRKGAVKRIKITNGGDLSKGKLLVDRINDNHRLIKKSRVRKLKARKKTRVGIQGIAKRLKAVL